MKILLKITFFLLLISCINDTKNNEKFLCTKGIVKKITYKHHGFGFHDVIVKCNVFYKNEKYDAKMIYKYNGVQPNNDFIVNDSVAVIVNPSILSEKSIELKSIKMFYRKLKNGFTIDHTTFDELCSSWYSTKNKN